MLQLTIWGIAQDLQALAEEIAKTTGQPILTAMADAVEQHPALRRYAAEWDRDAAQHRRAVPTEGQP